MQNVRLWTAQVKFHQVRTLIGSFWCKFVKFQLKGAEESCLMIIKSDAKFEKKNNNFLFHKWQELGKFWSEHSEVSKICTLIGPLYTKYKTFDQKKYIGVLFHDTEESTKIWRKTDLWDPFVQSRKCMT